MLGRLPIDRLPCVVRVKSVLRKGILGLGLLFLIITEGEGYGLCEEEPSLGSLPIFQQSGKSLFLLVACFKSGSAAHKCWQVQIIDRGSPRRLFGWWGNLLCG